MSDCPLLDLYQKTVAPQLQEKLGLKNKMQVPRIKAVTVNVGMGSYLQAMGKNSQSNIVENVQRITGQKPVVKHARLSVSNFKLREGMPVGVVVHLRGKAAYNFLYKLINITYPRVRGFLGVKKNIFDNQGNLSIGFNDYSVFPEALPDDTGRPFGLQVTVATTARNAEQGQELMMGLGFPFRK